MKVFGKNVFNELKNNTKQIRKVYLSSTFKDKEIIEFVKKNNLSYVTVDKRKFDTLVEGNTQGIILEISDYEYKNIKDIDYSKVNSVLSRNSYSNFKTIKKTKVRKYIINSVELATLALISLTNF